MWLSSELFICFVTYFWFIIVGLLMVFVFKYYRGLKVHCSLPEGSNPRERGKDRPAPIKILRWEYLFAPKTTPKSTEMHRFAWKNFKKLSGGMPPDHHTGEGGGRTFADPPPWRLGRPALTASAPRGLGPLRRLPSPPSKKWNGATALYNIRT